MGEEGQARNLVFGLLADGRFFVWQLCSHRHKEQGRHLGGLAEEEGAPGIGRLEFSTRRRVRGCG